MNPHSCNLPSFMVGAELQGRVQSFFLLLFASLHGKLVTLTGRPLQRKFNNWRTTSPRNDSLPSKLNTV